MNEEYFTFHLQYKHSGTFANRKCEELIFIPKNPKMCDPILVTPLKMRPRYSQSRRENATPSSGASPLASYKEVPPPPEWLISATEHKIVKDWESTLLMIKILFCSENRTPASFSVRALPFGSRFLVVILENEKNLSGDKSRIPGIPT